MRNAPLAATILVCTTLLGGCSVLRSIVDPAPTPTKPVQFAEPTACTDCIAGSSQAAASKPAVVAPPVAEPQPVVSTAPVAVAAKPEVRPLESAPLQANAPVRPVAVVTAPPPAPKAVVLAPGYHINVGLFAVPANGDAAQQKLKKLGLPVHAEQIDSKNGPVTRVRVGPYAKRSQADAAARKVRAAKLDAYVFKR